MDDPVTASAKAIEEGAKAAGKGLDIVHDTGGYLRSVFADAPADLVGVLGGAWLRERHIRLRDALRRRTEQILRERDVQELIELSPNIAAELIAGAQEEGREELMELWARLLANALDPNMNSVRRSFIDAAKRMDPTDALVLVFFYENKFTVVRSGNVDQEPGATNIEKIATAINHTRDEVELSLRHLLSISFFDQFNPRHDWHPNVTSREFMRACYPTA